MAGTVLQEANTFQSYNIAEQYFEKLPTDNRYIAVNDMTFDPITVLQGAKRMTFKMPAFSGPHIYLMQVLTKFVTFFYFPFHIAKHVF